MLRQINMRVTEGEVVCIIGPSGSGKSTLLRCLNFLEVPTSGEVIIDGSSLTNQNTNINAVRQKVGMVFQLFNLFPHKTALENVTMGPIKVKKLPRSQAEEVGRTLLAKVPVSGWSPTATSAGRMLKGR